MTQRFGHVGVSLLACLALAGCGGYPQPFAGRPGRQGARLSLPPPPRLVIAPPAEALLDSAHAASFAGDLASALADQEVPAVTTASKGADWRLRISAELTDGKVYPSYAVLNPKGIAQGSTKGAAVSPETWSLGAPTALKLVAARDAPAIATLLTSIQASVQQSDPNSLVNRPPRVVLNGVTGAPGDGNTALQSQIALQLASAGITVQPAAPGADYQVTGTVRIADAGAGQSRVEIQWTVLDPYGHEAGHLLQMNDIPAGSLDGRWGEIAVVVAQEAAGGVRDVIVNQTVSHHIGGKPGPGGKPPPPPA